MTIANMINKQVVIAAQGAKGTIAAVTAASAQYMRFKTFAQDQTNESYMSDEMRPDRQVGGVFIGPQDGNGSCSGELTPGTFEAFEAAVLRKVFVAGGSDAANTSVVAAAAATGAAGTFTRSDTSGESSGDWLADGFKVGDVIQMTGWLIGGLTNNDHNFLITTLTALVMTVLAVDGTPPATKAAGDSVVTTVKGQKCWTPATKHTEDWFTIEHYYSDVDLSEVFWDCKPTNMSVSAPATGIPTVDFNILGLQMIPEGTAASPYFTGYGVPLAITGTDAVHTGKAVIVIQGVNQVFCTGVDFEINGNAEVGSAVMGSNIKSGIYDKRLEVKGNFKALYQDDVISALYRAGTKISLSIVLPDSDAPDSAFIAISIPSAKVTSGAKEGDNEISHSFGFTAEFNSDGDDGVTCTKDSLATTLSLQDSSLS